ncbi:MAG: hypothetical protein QNJ49_17300 [Mastigocoleus sp. MO_167.B18]|uniref:hypothetical protein n=1 Tax=Mastigocoleus sp. MO_188.B34 TaxID=3036635 RepID=UPI0026371D50|nr:hypothetical protein [Mastigocoleus sp. MO_188.B34]MDJ0693835.1 hypothetical protein [Mastigocoleus sp. MO_188.B34]MDJ0775155.1 hypothetical protein [Mastigocoleus sp. MO_167.B18]
MAFIQESGVRTEHALTSVSVRRRRGLAGRKHSRSQELGLSSVRKSAERYYSN